MYQVTTYANVRNYKDRLSDSGFRLDPRVGKWERRLPNVRPRTHPGTAVFDGHLYAGGKEASSVERYSPLTNEWIDVPAMKRNRRTERLAVVNGKLYALDMTIVEVFDSEMNKWKHHSYLNQGRWASRCGCSSGAAIVPAAS
ncbi:kelch repeat protein [Cooperia oncophora]